MKKDYIIIKLYKGIEMYSPLHDIKLEEYEENIKRIKQYGKDNGFEVLVTASQSLDIADFDSFAEVYSPEKLNDQTQKFITDWVKGYMTDGYTRGEEMFEEQISFNVFFYTNSPYQIIDVEK